MALLELLVNGFGIEGIVKVLLVLWYVFALFVFNRLSSIERLHKWCGNATDRVSKTGNPALFELSAAREVGSLLPVPLGDYVRVIGKAFLLSLN